MRFILKIILLPFTLALALIVAVCNFLSGLSNAVLSVLAGICVLVAVVNLFSMAAANWGDVDFRTSICLLILAFLVSPFGIPKLFAAIVAWLERRKDGLFLFLQS